MATLPLVDTHVHYWDLRIPTLRYDWLEPEWIHPILGNIDGLKVLRYWRRPLRRRDPFPERREGGPRAGRDRHRRPGRGDEVAPGAGGRARVSRTGSSAHCDLAGQTRRRRSSGTSSTRTSAAIRDFGPGDYLVRSGVAAGLRTARRARPRVLRRHRLGGHGQGARAGRGTIPASSLCIDHAGFPRARDDEYFANWKGGLRDGAGAPNVVCKISGPRHVRQPVDRRVAPARGCSRCIEAFGVERMLLRHELAGRPPLQLVRRRRRRLRRDHRRLHRGGADRALLRATPSASSASDSSST